MGFPLVWQSKAMILHSNSNLLCQSHSQLPFWDSRKKLSLLPNGLGNEVNIGNRDWPAGNWMRLLGFCCLSFEIPSYTLQ